MKTKQKIFSILTLVLLLCTFFCTSVLAANVTTSLVRSSSLNLTSPDSIYLKTGNYDALALTPTNSIAVGERPYTQRNILYVNPTSNSSDADAPLVVVPTSYFIGASNSDLPRYTETFSFNASADSFTVVDYITSDTLKSTDTHLIIRTEDIYIPLRFNGNGGVNLHADVSPFYKLTLPLSNPTSIRVDYAFSGISYDTYGNKTYHPYNFKVQIDPVDGVYYIPSFPALDNSYVSSSTWQTFSPNVIDGIPSYTSSQLTNMVSSFSTRINDTLSGNYNVCRYDNLTITIYLNSSKKNAFSTSLPSEFTMITQTSISNSGYGSRDYLRDAYNDSTTVSLAKTIVDEENVLGWLSDTVDGFLGIELLPGFTLGTIALIVLAGASVLVVLKIFSGG